MDAQKKVCPACGQLNAAYYKNCSACNAALDLPVRSAAPAQAQPDLSLQFEPEPAHAESAPVEVAPVEQSRPSVQVFPERMKANRVLAERTCSGCAQLIDIGDDVWNCQTCGNTMHAQCYESRKVCGNAGCASRPKVAVVKPAMGMAPAVPAGEQVPCRFCGEMILKNARKCRFCNEYQSELDRKRNSKAKPEEDEKLAAAEIIFCFICPNIACIMAIVWMVQGKPKGWKMLLLSLVGQLVIGVLVQAVKHH